MQPDPWSAVAASIQSGRATAAYNLAVGRGREQDVTILDWWLARQYRAWWRRWWWLAILFGVLALIRLSWGVFDAWIRYMAFTVQQVNFIVTPAYKFWDSTNSYLSIAAFATSTAGFLILSWLAASLIPRLIPPAEIALTNSIEATRRRLLGCARRHYWLLFGLLALMPAMIVSCFRTALAICSFNPASLGEIEGYAYSIICILGIWLFVLEWQTALLLNLPYRRGRLPLYAMPVVMVVVVYMLLNFSATKGLLLFAPYAAWQSLPGTDDIWIAALHGGAVIAGLVVAARWWPYVVYRAEPRKWWNLVAAGWAGIVLPGVLWLKPNVWLGRAGYAAGAFFKGVLLGNPLGGWSGIWSGYANPYAFDYATYASMYRNFQLTHRDTTEIGMLGNDPGLVLAPYIYLPLYIALVWLALYYGYSLFIIWRANNRVPRGFRGTWEE